MKDLYSYGKCVIHATFTFIQSKIDDERELMLVAFIDGKHIGNCSLMSIAPYKRYNHRCDVAIALYKEYCGCGIGNIIHSKAGVQLRLKMNEIMEAQGHEEPPGQAKITPAYNLPCKYVLHTVGPIVQGPLTPKHENLLASCYKFCLDIAEENGVKSIAFCCISTGVFMFPNRKAAEIAVKTVKNWLDETGSDMKIVFNVFKDVDLDLYQGRG